MDTDVIRINDYLTFMIEHYPNGQKITCYYDGTIIGFKNPCNHNKCNVTFIAEMSIAADQMKRFETVFDSEHIAHN